MDLTAELGTRNEIITFKVVERFALNVILGRDFCNKHVEALRSRKSLVKLDDGTIVLIFRQPSSRQREAVRLPAARQNILKCRRTSKKILVQKPVIIKADSQTFVTVTYEQACVILVEPSRKVFNRHVCLADTGVNQVTPGQQFNILVANFKKTPKRLLSNQFVAIASKHPTQLVESCYSHREIFGVVDEEQAYSKR